MRITKPLSEEIYQSYEALFNVLESGVSSDEMSGMRANFLDIQSRVKENENEQKELAEFREKAKKNFHEDGVIEVDDSAIVSIGDEAEGAYVEAWVWVESV